MRYMILRKLNNEGIWQFKNIIVENAPDRVAQLLKHGTSIKISQVQIPVRQENLQLTQSGLYQQSYPYIVILFSKVKNINIWDILSLES